MPANTSTPSQSPMCVDKALVKRRFHCASKTYDAHATVQKEMAQALVQMAMPGIWHRFRSGCWSWDVAPDC